MGARVLTGPLEENLGRARLQVLDAACAGEVGSRAGVALPDLLVSVALISTLLAAALPLFATVREWGRGVAAAHYLAGRLRAARADALARSSRVAVQFSGRGGRLGYAVYRDGNGNGVRTSEIRSRVDPEVAPWEALSGQFPGVDFGFVAGRNTPAPPPDSQTFTDADDPIRFGPSRLASFSAMGTGTPGSVYLRTRGGDQFAVRILGGSGRIRVLHYEPATRVWRSR